MGQCSTDSSRVASRVTRAVVRVPMQVFEHQGSMHKVSGVVNVVMSLATSLLCVCVIHVSLSS